jgi:Na+/phosphate symporter
VTTFWLLFSLIAIGMILYFAGKGKTSELGRIIFLCALLAMLLGATRFGRVPLRSVDATASDKDT